MTSSAKPTVSALNKKYNFKQTPLDGSFHSAVLQAVYGFIIQLSDGDLISQRLSVIPAVYHSES